MAGKFEVYKDKAGKYRFRLKAGNGQIIAVGEAYESKAAVMNGIESIRGNAAAAALVDMSEADAPAPPAMR
ncbi:YegP family protein [Catenulispora yoronensis]|uniref:YegP family protein n=1 Tax=Catenulispora yoronensis TaxID=450799 RepID=A0ABP5GJI2_9ACTN